MKNIIIIFATLTSLVTASNTIAETYKVPPSSSTSSHTPIISDAKMEQCVILYNKAENLMKQLNSTRVDNYSQVSVDNYNNKVGQHSRMISNFNHNCAGKQSASAAKAAKKLNRQNR